VTCTCHVYGFYELLWTHYLHLWTMWWLWWLLNCLWWLQWYLNYVWWLWTIRNDYKLLVIMFIRWGYHIWNYIKKTKMTFVVSKSYSSQQPACLCCELWLLLSAKRAWCGAWEPPLLWALDPAHNTVWKCAVSRGPATSCFCEQDPWLITHFQTVLRAGR
jgi:hypothetical protein